MKESLTPPNQGASFFAYKRERGSPAQAPARTLTIFPSLHLEWHRSTTPFDCVALSPSLERLALGSARNSRSYILSRGSLQIDREFQAAICRFVACLLSVASSWVCAICGSCVWQIWNGWVGWSSAATGMAASRAVWLWSIHQHVPAIAVLWLWIWCRV